MIFTVQSLQLSADCLRKDSILDFLHHGHLQSDELRNTAAMNVNVICIYFANCPCHAPTIACDSKTISLRYVHNPAVILSYFESLEDPESPAKDGSQFVPLPLLGICVRSLLTVKPVQIRKVCPARSSPDSYPVTCTSL